MRGRRVGVLAGGLSEEAGVSLVSGQGVMEALKAAGCDATLVVLNDQDPAKIIKDSGIEVAFPVTHGIYGEDGCLQGLLEWMGIPYVGSGVLASALAMNKTVANAILKTRGLPVPDGVTIDTDDPDALSKIDAALASRPVCIKPNAGGSSVGIELVDDPADRAAASLSFSLSPVLLLTVIGNPIPPAMSPSENPVPNSSPEPSNSSWTKASTRIFVSAPSVARWPLLNSKMASDSEPVSMREPSSRTSPILAERLPDEFASLPLGSVTETSPRKVATMVAPF